MPKVNYCRTSGNPIRLGALLDAIDGEMSKAMHPSAPQPIKESCRYDIESAIAPENMPQWLVRVICGPCLAKGWRRKLLNALRFCLHGLGLALLVAELSILALQMHCYETEYNPR